MDYDTVRALQMATGCRMLKVHHYDPLKKIKAGRVYQLDDTVFVACEGDVALTMHPAHVDRW